MDARMMKNGSETWKALALLKEMQSQLTGFDFRIRFGDDKVPIGLVWMTYPMRQHLLQYGDIMFLDAQKRQYNKLCWPYIGPSVRTNENYVRVVAESVVLTEDLSTYKWILNSIVEMEPKWQISKLRIIFADGLITQTLLDELNISETCTLRCDYWHLMNEVFPKNHNFGNVGFALIKNHLKKMLLCDSEDQWKTSYNDASTILEDFPLKMEKLKDIYDRPSYYAGYYVRQLQCNMLLVGSQSAESNHASITRHLGDCGVWTISYQISKLMERQQYFINFDRTATDDLYVRQSCYQSKYKGDLGKHDMEAKKILSAYAYKNYWLQAIKVSEQYQSRSCNKDTHHIVWKCGELLKVDNFVAIQKGHRCECKFRTSLGCPCHHEFSLKIKFDISQYNSRWLCPHAFIRLYPEYTPTTNVVTSIASYDTGCINENEMCTSKNQHYNELPQHGCDSITSTVGNIGFVELTRVANELVKSVVNDCTLSKNVYKNMIEWTRLLRSNKKFDIRFVPMQLDNTGKGTVTENTPIQEPLPACTKTATVLTAQKRKLSHREKITYKRNKQSAHSKVSNAENLRLPFGRSNTKSCALCKGRGHSRTNCVRLMENYGKYPVPLTDNSQRRNIAMNLNANIFNGSPLFKRQVCDQRVIIREFPKQVKCLIIHQRFMINETVVTVFSQGNVCVECTIIRNEYQILRHEQKILFEPLIIMPYILNHNNLVVCQC